METQTVNIYNDVYEKGKTFKSYDKTLDFLDNRVKETYMLKGIIGLEIMSNGMKILFGVHETDNNLILNGSYMEKEFFIPKYVWSHLTGFLKIPSPVYDFYQSFHGLLDKEDFKTCQNNEAENLEIMFNNRLEAKKQNNRLKDIFITVFKDSFGEYPRVIHSELYYPYRDSEALETVNNGFEALNRKYDDRDYGFKTAFLTPYCSNFNYTNNLTKTPTKIGEELESGLMIKNSECKLASFTFQTLMVRLACLNGLISNFRDSELKIKHYENGFERKIQNGFVKSLKLENKFASQYLKACEKTKPISLEWNDIQEIPNSILAMKPNEKQELIEIAKFEDYEFSPYGILQALTYKTTHRVHDDSNKERINKKALHILDNIDLLSEWKPKRLETTA